MMSGKSSPKKQKVCPDVGAQAEDVGAVSSVVPRVPIEGIEASESAVSGATGGSAATSTAKTDLGQVDLVAMFEDLRALKAGMIEVNEKLDKTNEELDKTNTELIEVNEKLDKTKEEQEKTNTELIEVNEKLANFEARLDNFVGAFEPAIQYAVFETFIYSFVQLELDTVPNISVTNPQSFKHKMAVFCRNVIQKLLPPTEAALQSDHGLGFPMVVESTELTKRLMLRALQGLAEYVTHVGDEETIRETFNVTLLNGLSHNGGFLCALFPELKEKICSSYLGGEGEKESREELKKEVNKYSDQIIDRKSQSKIPDGTLTAIEDVVTAIKSKNADGITVNVDDKDKVVTQIESKLEGKDKDEGKGRGKETKNKAKTG